MKHRDPSVPQPLQYPGGGIEHTSPLANVIGARVGLYLTHSDLIELVDAFDETASDTALAQSIRELRDQALSTYRTVAAS